MRQEDKRFGMAADFPEALDSNGFQYTSEVIRTKGGWEMQDPSATSLS